MTIAEAVDRLGLSEQWIYRLIKKGVIRVAESGRHGRGHHTTVLVEDVEREKAKRKAALVEQLKKMDD